MNNVYIILCYKNGEIMYNGIQCDGGEVAKQMVKDYGYILDIWNMGNKKHLYEMSKEVRAEIKEKINKGKEITKEKNRRIKEKLKAARRARS